MRHIGLDKARTDRNKQFARGLCKLCFAIANAHVRGKRLFEITGPFIPHFEQKRRGPTSDEPEDALVKVRVADIGPPAETLRQRIKRPEALVVALRGDGSPGPQKRGQTGCKLICPADMPREDRDDEAAGAVDTDHCRIAVLVLQCRRDAANADTHRPDENDAVQIIPFAPQKRVIRARSRAIRLCAAAAADSDLVRS